MISSALVVAVWGGALGPGAGDHSTVYRQMQPEQRVQGMGQALPLDPGSILAKNDIMFPLELLTAPAAVIEIPALPDTRYVEGGPRQG